jgi:hypothetical protein
MLPLAFRVRGTARAEAHAHTGGVHVLGGEGGPMPETISPGGDTHPLTLSDLTQVVVVNVDHPVIPV